MALSDTIIAQPPPLRVEDDGTVRIGQSRVTLDSVIAVFENGASAEGIAEKYPSLSLADVYATIAYYLVNREVVDEYLARRAEEEADARTLIDSRSPRDGIRERLLARARDDGRPR